MAAWSWAGTAAAEPLDILLPDSPPEQVFSAPVSTDAPRAVDPFGAGPAVRLVHPPEGARLPYLKSSFVLGSADPRGRLTVNGQPVPIHPEGGFVTMVSYTTGTFTIRAELALNGSTTTVTRRVVVAPPSPPAPAFPLAIQSVKPEADASVLPGEPVNVSVRASPGHEASFQVQGVRGRFPLTEDPGSSGRGAYRGVFVPRAGDELERAWIRVTLSDMQHRSKITEEAPGRLSLLDDRVPTVLEVSTDIAVLRAGPAASAGDKAGYALFPAPGSRLHAVGRRGKEWKVRLTADRAAWIGDSEAKVLPRGTPLPRPYVGSLSVTARGRSTEVRVAVGTKVPFEVVPSEDGGVLDVRLFGAVSNTDWIHYESTGVVVRRVEWRQEGSDVYAFRVFAEPGAWWGYDARYEGDTFVLELRRPPSDPFAKSPLEGLVVAVDAGHASDKGSVGPTELLEKDANRAIAACLQKKLAEEGAQVVMVRPGDQHVDLYDRPKVAWQAKADLLVSVHNNAVPEGSDPRERGGYSVYYFHPHSFALAKDVHRAYGDVLGGTLKDDGLHYGNLALARASQMPAVLTESAYMVLPREEALLKKESFQCDCAESVLRGLRAFVRRYRAPRAAPAKASPTKKSR
jgi:N-acetylmuramoyl-L-alanine amidase